MSGLWNRGGEEGGRRGELHALFQVFLDDEKERKSHSAHKQTSQAYKFDFSLASKRHRN